jgi:hypothetical protein
MSDILSLPVQHGQLAPVFVIGSARSGTSLLCSLMRRYLQISFGTESQFLVRVYRDLPQYGDLATPATCVAWLTTLLGNDASSDG